MIKAFLRKILPHKIWQKIATFKNLYITKFSTKSYAQEGEDLILSEIFASHTKGFYVDIGAHHPFRFSNTYLFYKKGWRGINVDAMPGSMKLFNTFRSRDINIECGIAKKLHKNTLGGGGNDIL